MELVLYAARSLSPRTYALVVVASLSLSFMFALVASTANGLYATLERAVVAEAPGLVTAGSATAFTPFTGLIPGDVAERGASVEGVVAVLPEVVFPALVNGSVGIVRGVDFEAMAGALGLRVVEGEFPGSSCLYCAALGVDAARALKASPGDLLVLRSAFTPVPVEVRVTGIVECGNPYDGEVLVPLVLAQSARGVGGNAVSLVRFKLGPGASPEFLAERLGIEPAGGRPLPTYLVERAVAGLRYAPGRAVLATPREVTDTYLSRLGLSYDTLLALSMVVLVLLSYGSYLLGMTAVAVNRGSLRVLREIGMSRLGVSAVVLAALLPLVAASVLAGLLAALAAGSVAERFLLTYRVEPRLGVLEAASSCLVLSLLFALGVLREEV